MTTGFASELIDLARSVGQRLQASGLMLVTAESCTGGLVAAAITAVPGSSAWFDRGYVTYSNESKEELLGVQPETLASHGAVSAETALEMVAGAVARSRARVGVAITGIAGPGGGSPEKPVGTVWIAWSDAAGRRTTERLQLGGDRDAVRHGATAAALRGVLDRVTG